MEHLGDITKLNGACMEPVNVIIGGSPCQDLSVAGRREGLYGERSGLFMEQIRIIKEMRDADRILRGRSGKDVRPRLMVWENVPGALSSKRRPIFLSLRTDGLQPDAYQWEVTDPSQWHTAYSMPSFGESPSGAVESHLSQILQVNAPRKYYLSAKAADGILRRAERRGKELPEMLKQALLEVIAQEQTAQ